MLTVLTRQIQFQSSGIEYAENRVLLFLECLNAIKIKVERKDKQILTGYKRTITVMYTRL